MQAIVDQGIISLREYGVANSSSSVTSGVSSSSMAQTELDVRLANTASSALKFMNHTLNPLVQVVQETSKDNALLMKLDKAMERLNNTKKILEDIAQNSSAVVEKSQGV